MNTKKIPQLSDEDKSRFWQKVKMAGSDDCWNWTSVRTRKQGGYGHFSISRKKYVAHRVSWVLAYGQVPNDLLVLHTCDNTICVNPSHLFLGTQDDNMLDMVIKQRSPHTKLTDKEAEQILALLAGGMSQREAGECFDSSQEVVSALVQGITKRHLPRPDGIKSRPRYGEQSPNAKLKEDDVKQILQGLVDGKTRRELAERYRVTTELISALVCGRIWPHVPRPAGIPAGQVRGEQQKNSKLTESDVLEIRRLYATGDYSYASIAKIFPVHPGQILKIVRRIAWKHVK